MILATQTDAGVRFGDEKVVRWICEAGFDAVDYSMYHMRNDDHILNTNKYESHVLELKKIVEDYGKFFVQAHSPFPSCIEGDEKYNKTVEERINRSIEIAGILGVKNIVIHPVDYKCKKPEQKLEKNFELYTTKFLPTAKANGVKIAVENMFGWDPRRNVIMSNICSEGLQFRQMMDMLDPEWFTACVDIGHAGLVGSTAPDMLRTLGNEYVGCLHVHDNDYLRDRHYPPFMFDLDWEEITQALADINYKEAFTFESDEFLRKLPESVMPSAFIFLHAIGRSLIEKVEAKRS